MKTIYRFVGNTLITDTRRTRKQTQDSLNSTLLTNDYCTLLVITYNEYGLCPENCEITVLYFPNHFFLLPNSFIFVFIFYLFWNLTKHLKCLVWFVYVAKEKLNLNNINWKRHVTSCDIVKLKKNEFMQCFIKLFFTKTRKQIFSWWH